MRLFLHVFESIQTEDGELIVRSILFGLDIKHYEGGQRMLIICLANPLGIGLE